MLSAREADERREYRRAVRDLAASRSVLGMGAFRQHGAATTLTHCLNVSYMSYRICRRLGLDARAAARGALLHDLYLYDWHDTPKEYCPHAFTHPDTALKNAGARFPLGRVERDVIKNHMWPLTIYRVPRCAESYVVSLADKCCAVMETFKFI